MSFFSSSISSFCPQCINAYERSDASKKNKMLKMLHLNSKENEKSNEQIWKRKKWMENQIKCEFNFFPPHSQYCWLNKCEKNYNIFIQIRLTMISIFKLLTKKQKQKGIH